MRRSVGLRSYPRPWFRGRNSSMRAFFGELDDEWYLYQKWPAYFLERKVARLVRVVEFMAMDFITI